MSKICVICLEDIKGGEKFLRCTHVFHEKCINEWEAQKPECPICKNPMYDKPVVDNLIRRPPSFSTFVAGAGLALGVLAITHPSSGLINNPYIYYVDAIAREFARDIISQNYPIIKRQIQNTVEEKRPSRIFEKARELEQNLLQKNVDLSSIPELNQNLSRESINFIYMKLLEKRDDYNRNNTIPI